MDKPTRPNAPYSRKRNIPGGVPGLQTRRKVPCIFGRFDSYLFRQSRCASVPNVPMKRDMAAGRKSRLLHLGFPTDQAQRLADMHTGNFM